MGSLFCHSWSLPSCKDWGPSHFPRVQREQTQEEKAGQKQGAQEKGPISWPLLRTRTRERQKNTFLSDPLRRRQLQFRDSGVICGCLRLPLSLHRRLLKTVPPDLAGRCSVACPPAPLPTPQSSQWDQGQSVSWRKYLTGLLEPVRNGRIVL